MTSIYKLLQHEIPYCSSHSSNKTTHYDIEKQQFYCTECLNSSSSLSSSLICELETILKNPIILMLKQTSFLNSCQQIRNNYHFGSFMKIMQRFQHFLKTNKQNNELFKTFMSKLKEQINNKINELIQISQKNTSVINKQLQPTFNELKRINQTYTNQFLQSLETVFSEQTQGDEGKINKLFKTYSIQNEYPFRKVSQKVEEITKNANKLINFDWEYLRDQFYQNLIGQSLWDEERMFKSKEIKLDHVDQNQDLEDSLSREEKSVQIQQKIILPDSPAFLLGSSTKSKSKHPRILSNLNKSKILSSSLNRFLSYTKQELRLYRSNPCNQQYASSSQDFSSFNIMSTFCLIDSLKLDDERSYDMIYQLPRCRLIGVTYNLITVFSYHNDKLEKLCDLNIKGCSDVRIEDDGNVIIEAMGRCYMVNVGKVKNNQIERGKRIVM